MSGRATLTTVMSRSSMKMAVHTAMRVHHLRSRLGTIPSSGPTGPRPQVPKSIRIVFEPTRTSIRWVSRLPAYLEHPVERILGGPAKPAEADLAQQIAPCRVGHLVAQRVAASLGLCRRGADADRAGVEDPAHRVHVVLEPGHGHRLDEEPRAVIGE